MQWPQGESAPTKYWLSTLPADADLETLVATAKVRWRIERDYQELKQVSWRAASRDACPVVLVANEPTYDTVRLGACLDNSGLWWRRLLESDSVCL